MQPLSALREASTCLAMDTHASCAWPVLALSPPEPAQKHAPAWGWVETAELVALLYRLSCLLEPDPGGLSPGQALLKPATNAVVFFHLHSARTLAEPDFQVHCLAFDLLPSRLLLHRYTSVVRPHRRVAQVAHRLAQHAAR